MTFLILRFLFLWFDDLLKPIERFFFDTTFPGLGVGLLLLVIYVSGVLFTQVATRKGLALLRPFFFPIPLLRPLFILLEKIIEFAGSAPKLERFQRVVAIEYPWPGTYALAFATGETVVNSDVRLQNVYIPTPTTIQTGVFSLVPDDQVLETNLTMDDTIKLMVSAGLIHPPETRLYPARGGTTEHQV
ncbi:MAG: DUF502 domain-containing protein [Chloroflexi bacterium]|nr:DUF502 domain-containing protein [Chloroflexota bacterium]